VIVREAIRKLREIKEIKKLRDEKLRQASIFPHLLKIVKKCHARGQTRGRPTMTEQEIPTTPQEKCAY
jgi:hypothetical protein